MSQTDAMSAVTRRTVPEIGRSAAEFQNAESCRNDLRRMVKDEVGVITVMLRLQNQINAVAVALNYAYEPPAKTRPLPLDGIQFGARLLHLPAVPP